MKNLLGQLFPLMEKLEISSEMIYSLHIINNTVSFQGKFDSNIVKDLMSKNFEFVINENGYAVGEKEIPFGEDIVDEDFGIKVRIVLT